MVAPSEIVPAERTGWPSDLLARPAAQRTRAEVTAAQDAWTRTRHAALVAELSRGPSPTPNAPLVAAAVVAHWARETGWGLAEWRYNLGNIKAYASWHGQRQQLPDGLWYRAFTSLDEGVANTVALLRAPLYAAAWARLVAQPTDAAGWYDALMRAGWHPWSQSALNDYRDVYARVCRVLGLSTLPNPAPTSAPTSARAVAAVALGAAALAARMTL